MIRKRLFSLMAESKKYIVLNILWQWLGLLASIVAMFTVGQLLEEGYLRRLDGGRLLLFGVILIAAVLFRAVCTRQGARASCMAGNDVKRELRRRLYEKLMSLGASYHEKVSTASAVQMAAEGVEQLEIYFGKYLPQLVFSLLAPITLFGALSLISLRASLVLLVCVPLIPAAIMGVQSFAKRLLGKYWGIYTGLGDSFLENLQGLTTLKIYQADQEKAIEMDRESEHFRKITMKVLMMQLNSIIVMDVVAYGGAAAGMLVTIREFMAGHLGLAGACTIVLLSAEFFLPMRLLGSFFHIAMNGMAASDKLFAILDIEEDGEGDKALTRGPLDIILENVEFSYEKERPILRGVSMKLPKTGLVSLVGQSGCGKSTVAAILTGAAKGAAGSIRLKGLELSGLSESSLLARVTLVGHSSYLFKGTVEENLKMAAPQATEAKMKEALQEVELYDFLMEQKGLKTELAERGSNLSGGQCQRLALARALLHDSAVYIFDEATSNIDAESESQIMKVIKKLARSRSVLLISHRLANVVDSARIYVLRDGRIAEEGQHEELMEKNGIYAGLYLGQKELEGYTEAVRKGERIYA